MTADKPVQMGGISEHPFGLHMNLRRVDGGPVLAEALAQGHIADCPVAWPDDAQMVYGWGGPIQVCPHVSHALDQAAWDAEIARGAQH